MHVYTTPARLFREIFTKLLSIDESFNLDRGGAVLPDVQRWLHVMDTAYRELWESHVGPELYSLARLKSREREHRLRFEELVSLGFTSVTAITKAHLLEEIIEDLDAVQKLIQQLSESLEAVDPAVALIDYHFIWTDQHYGSSTESARELLRRCMEEPTQEVFAEYVEWANEHLSKTEAALRMGSSYPNNLFKLRSALNELEVYLLVSETK